MLPRNTIAIAFVCKNTALTHPQSYSCSILLLASLVLLVVLMIVAPRALRDLASSDGRALVRRVFGMP